MVTFDDFANTPLLQARVGMLRLLLRGRNVLVAVYPRLFALNLAASSTAWAPNPQRSITDSMEDGLQWLQNQPNSEPFTIITTEHLSDGSGIALIKRAKEISKAYKTLLVLTHNHQLMVDQATQQGADAVVLETSLGRTGSLVYALHCLNRGRCFVDPAFSSARPPLELPSGQEQLTPREVEILRLVAKGMSNRQIGEALHIATSTARDHVQEILRRMRVNSRAAAAVEGLRQGYLV